MKKHNAELTYQARMLRKNMTPQEKKLWYDFLKTYSVNVLRQKIIGPYIVDFYCSKAKLVIEINGDYHNYIDQAKDNERTNYIKEFGLEMIFIDNSFVDNNFDECCQYIDKTIKERINNLK